MRQRVFLKVGSEVQALNLRLKEEKHPVVKADREELAIWAEVKAGCLRAQIRRNQALVFADVPEHERLIVADRGQYFVLRVQASDDLLLLVAELQRAVALQDRLELDVVFLVELVLVLQPLQLVRLLLLRHLLVIDDLVGRQEVAIEIDQALDDVTASYAGQDLHCGSAVDRMLIAWEHIEALHPV